MKKHLIIFYATLNILLLTYNNSFAAIKNRFTHGPNMVARNIEYISHSTQVIYEITYNLYLHPEIIKNMLKKSSDDAFKISHSTVITQARKICQNSNANLCTVYLWSNLESIPTGNDFSQNSLSRATGYLKYYKNTPPGKLKNYEYKWKPLDKEEKSESKSK